jgi:hypothetical protein
VSNEYGKTIIKRSRKELEGVVIAYFIGTIPALGDVGKL